MYPGQHAGPPRRHPLLKIFGIIAAGVAVLIVIVAVATSGHHGVQRGNAPVVPPSSAPSSPASAPPDSSSGPVGTPFTVQSTDDNGNPVTYQVAVTKVDQHAELAAFNTLDNPADHMAAVRFTVTGVKGQSSDDVLSDATAYGKDTTTYEASLNDVKEGSAFNSGSWQVGPGQTVSGWAAFELPPGATVAQVKWTPTAGMSDSSATWNVQ